jgi:hypothetical protein
MASDRDPRKDPKPGDALRGVGEYTRFVRYRDSKQVQYTLEPAAQCVDTLAVSIYGWRVWAANAEVLHAAD